VTTLWDEVLRFENPQSYYVDLSDKLWRLRTSLIEDYQKQMADE
jgi:nicotinate phosphoribosyltransferase